MRRALLTVHKFFPDHRAGTEVLTLKVAQELKRRGTAVLVVAANPPDLDARQTTGPLTSDYQYEGVDVHVVEEALRLKGYTFAHEYYHPEVKLDFEKVLRRFRPDIVHSFHLQNLSACVIDAAGEAGVPVVCTATDFWFVCPNVQLRKPNAAVCRGPSAGAINCLTCYTPHLFAPSEQFALALREKHPQCARWLADLPSPFSSACVKGLYGVYAASKLPSAVAATRKRRFILREAANRAAAIMVPTRLMWDIFVENGIREQRLHHVPFGIDEALFAADQGKEPSDVLRLGYIGTLSEHKGVDLLISAVQRLNVDEPVSLTIYGDTEQFPQYSAKLKALAGATAHRHRIRFAGTFPNVKFAEVMTCVDVLVVPSRWYENTPLVIQSALATKTPLIVTDLGGMSEIVSHEENGLLFQLNDVDSLRQQIARLLCEPGLLDKLRRGIRPQRTIAQMVDDIEEVYDSVLPVRKRNDGSRSERKVKVPEGS